MISLKLDDIYFLNNSISRQNKIDIVDIQNASLSGGVAVGAIADLMIQPYGAFFMGSICGVVSTLGYRLLQVNNTFKTMSTSFSLHIFHDPRMKYS